MYAVLEEVENNLACLVPDSGGDPIYLPEKALPESFEIGDVYHIQVKDNGHYQLKKDTEEKENRLSENEMKRKRLLKRSNDTTK